MGVDGAWWLPRPSKPLWDDAERPWCVRFACIPAIFSLTKFNRSRTTHMIDSKENAQDNKIRLTKLTEKGG